MTENGYFQPPLQAPAPGAAARFFSVDRDVPSMQVIPGLRIAPVFGEGFSTNFVHWDPDTVAEPHAHAEEQLVIVVEGTLVMDVDGEARDLGPGDAVLIPAWVPHQGSTRGEAAYQLDVFCPGRESVRQMLAQHEAEQGAGG